MVAKSRGEGRKGDKKATTVEAVSDLNEICDNCGGRNVWMRCDANLRL